MVQVIEAFSDYAPLCDARFAIEDLLALTPAETLAGLRTVVLTNAAALKGRRKRGWSWHRGRKASHADALRMYHGEWRGDPAWIELFVDQILGDTPQWVLKLSLARNFVFGPTLYHELGHHIHRRHRLEQREPEDVADGWKRTLMRGHLRRRHPAARLVLVLLAWIVGGLWRRPPRPLECGAIVRRTRR
jgi:hypothetical protein